MNGWLTTANLVPSLGLIPLGAAVAATFMQRDPARSGRGGPERTAASGAGRRDW